MTLYRPHAQMGLGNGYLYSDYDTAMSELLSKMIDNLGVSSFLPQGSLFFP